MEFDKDSHKYEWSLTKRVNKDWGRRREGVCWPWMTLLDFYCVERTKMIFLFCLSCLFYAKDSIYLVYNLKLDYVRAVTSYSYVFFFVFFFC